MGFRVKRCFDLIGSATLILCLVPLLLLIGVLIRLTSPGPILYVQERVGLHGRRFRMLKFRTMAVGSDAVNLAHHRNDPRITPVGRLLRRLSLDELPQLWNVLRGEMSLIGPRPMLPDVAESLPHPLRRRHHMRPGLTGLAQVRGRNALSLAQRVAYDVEYVDRWSLLLDIQILGKTASTVLSGRGLYGPNGWNNNGEPDGDRVTSAPSGPRSPVYPPNSPQRGKGAMGVMKRLGLLAADAALLSLAAWLSAGLIAWEFQPPIRLPDLWPLAVAAAVYCIAGAALGVYRRLWQYAGLRDALAVLLACLASGAFLLVLPTPLSFSLRALFWLTATAGLFGFRLALRVVWSRSGAVRPAQNRSIVVIGAGAAGTELIRELQRHPELGITAVGFLDDDPEKHGREAYGVRVLGSSGEVGRVVREHGVSEVLIAIPSAPTGALRRIWSEAAVHGVAVRILPPLGDLDQRQRLVQQIRSVRLPDLLGRPEVQIDQEAVSGYLTGRTVLVTGAGGSIGSELCRQVLAFSPARLVLFGHGENSLYQTQLELRSLAPGLPLTVAVGDVQDVTALDRVFRELRPNVVFHAAAHKHVPLMEQNPPEAVKNNVMGTYNVALAAQRHGASHFVLISTDKAVSPSSVMGATKRAAEVVTAALARQGPCRMVAVRFGNVLGSRGSVVPLFQQQITAGGPITVTHPEVTRFFMTIPEAARLVLQAGAMGSSGDRFVLDMGQPVRIVDLAKTLARLAAPDREIPVIFTGLRPGEKLHEELFDSDEVVSQTAHPRIRRAVAGLPADFDLATTLADLRRQVDRRAVSVESILAALGDKTRGDDRVDGVDHQPVGAAQSAH